MQDEDHSTLWRISAFERLRAGGADGGPMGIAPSTMLPSTLQSELDRLHAHADTDDVLEVMAACLRHRESALLYVGMAPYVWSVTLFPIQGIYHARRDVADPVMAEGLGRLKLISAERPIVRPPGHWLHERVSAHDKYHPMSELVWEVALRGPRATLLTEISGRTAYRLAPGRGEDRPVPSGAIASAIVRLRKETGSLREMTSWPGMSLERASRLLNALYLTDSLIVMRTHPRARKEPMDWGRLLGRRR